VPSGSCAHQVRKFDCGRADQCRHACSVTNLRAGGVPA
jgi:hypothetical protein